MLLVRTAVKARSASLHTLFAMSFTLIFNRCTSESRSSTEESRPPRKDEKSVSPFDCISSVFRVLHTIRINFMILSKKYLVSIFGELVARLLDFFWSTSTVFAATLS